jgi:hypothetical protein
MGMILKNRLLLLVTILGCLALLGLLASCSSSTSNGSPAVAYEITGTASSVSVTLSDPTGDTKQYNDVSVPHTYSYSSFPGNFLYISAENQGDYGSVTVTIYVDGKIYKTSTSSDASPIATASGTK